MTNDDIKKAVEVFFNKELATHVSPDAKLWPMVDALDAFARSLVAQAYEEAAQKALIFEDREMARALEIFGTPAIRQLVQAHGRGIASSIRAWKDSLCPHQWVDARNEVIMSGKWCPKCGALRADESASVSP